MSIQPINRQEIPRWSDEQGSTLIVFLVLLMVMGVLAMGALRLVNLDLQMSDAHQKGKKAFYSAEVGLDLAVNDIIEEFDDLSVYTESANYPGADGDGFITRNDYRGYDVSYKITNPVDRYLYQTVQGNTTIYHYAYTYDVEANAVSLNDNSNERVRETIRILETPLVQYYVFYAGTGNAADLEIFPGPTMNSWGRIHSNGDIYIGANNAFNLRNYDDSLNLSPHGISSGGSIIRQRKDNGSTPGGNVVVKTSGTGTTFTPTQTVTTNITAGNETSEETRFNDYVLVNERAYTVPSKTQFVRGGFYEDRAGDPQRPTVDGIKIVGTGGLGGGTQVFVSRPNPNTDVTAMVQNGTLPDGSSAGLALPMVRESDDAFEDCRESDRDVDTTDIDLYLLQTWYERYLDYYGLDFAGDGVLMYVSRSPNASFTNQSGDLQAVRLMRLDATSQAQILDETTLATDNPIYVQGDFNTVSTRGVALVSDAVNILSNAFSGKNCGSGLDSATETTLNAAFFGGNVPTPAGGGNYSGGLENYPRFHESWSGVDCNINGSFINLWSSSQADGNWVYGGDRYQAPGRIWGWDVRFQDPDFWPPFIPSIFSVERVGFLE